MLASNAALGHDPTGCRKVLPHDTRWLDVLVVRGITKVSQNERSPLPELPPDALYRPVPRLILGITPSSIDGYFGLLRAMLALPRGFQFGLQPADAFRLLLDALLQPFVLLDQGHEQGVSEHLQLSLSLSG